MLYLVEFNTGNASVAGHKHKLFNCLETSKYLPDKVRKKLDKMEVTLEEYGNSWDSKTFLTFLNKCKISLDVFQNLLMSDEDMSSSIIYMDNSKFVKFMKEKITNRKRSYLDFPNDYVAKLEDVENQLCFIFDPKEAFDLVNETEYNLFHIRKDNHLFYSFNEYLEYVLR